jgi:hypothetical protein
MVHDKHYLYSSRISPSYFDELTRILAEMTMKTYLWEHMARPIKGWNPAIQIFAIDVRHVGAQPIVKISMSIYEYSHHYLVRYRTVDTK